MSEKVTEINKPEDNEMKLKLSREYDFEGQKICEIDLSGLDNLTAADMIQANKVLTNNGTVSVLPETTLEYDLIIAAGALISTHTPLTGRDDLQQHHRRRQGFK